MRPRSLDALALAPIILALAACEVPKVNPATATLAPELPLADLHLHPHPGLSPSAIKEAMDANGVRWAGAGAAGGNRSTWLAVSQEMGDRFIAFAGQTELGRAYSEGGVAAMEDAEHPVIQALLRGAEADLRARRIKGIGEIFVNNSRSHPSPAFRRKARADAPSIRLLYQLVARHGAFLTFHMHADPDSVDQLERLLTSDRSGRILWNHCGSDTDARDVRPLLARHPNLFCELSFRYPPVLPAESGRDPRRKIFDRTGPDPDWLRLIEDFPNRFMIETDASSRSDYDGAIRVVRTGLLPYLSPPTARKVAYENAQQLFELK